jgi:hypothetical protein
MVLDVRIRNNGSSTANLTRATLKFVRGVPEAWSPDSGYEPSAIYKAVYKISSRRVIFLGRESPSASLGNFHGWALLERSGLAEESFPVAHVLKPGEVDSFIIKVNTAAGIDVQLILAYNGDLTAASREIPFVCP